MRVHSNVGLRLIAPSGELLSDEPSSPFAPWPRPSLPSFRLRSLFFCVWVFFFFLLCLFPKMLAFPVLVDAFALASRIPCSNFHPPLPLAFAFPPRSVVAKSNLVYGLGFPGRMNPRAICGVFCAFSVQVGGRSRF